MRRIIGLTSLLLLAGMGAARAQIDDPLVPIRAAECRLAYNLINHQGFAFDIAAKSLPERLEIRVLEVDHDPLSVRLTENSGKVIFQFECKMTNFRIPIEDEQRHNLIQMNF